MMRRIVAAFRVGLSHPPSCSGRPLREVAGRRCVVCALVWDTRGRLMVEKQARGGSQTRL